MNFTQLMAMLGDVPKDSPAGKAVQQFVAFLFAEAKTQGGPVGVAFRKAVDALRNSADPIYAKMAPLDAAGVQGTVNGMKGYLDA